MYPQGGGNEPAGDDYLPPEGGFKSRVASNIEGLIPLILIIIIAGYAGAKLGFWSIPFLDNREPVAMLIIGEPSHATQVVLDKDRDLVRYVIRNANDLSVSPEQQLQQYKIVLLDQSKQADKTVPRVLGDAINEWVKQGGKFIVVKDSGIYREGASDVVGWQATFGDIMPVMCNVEKDFVPTCTKPVHVRGRIYRQDWKHKIMEGIEVAPIDPDGVYFLETFNIAPTGNQVAFIKSVDTPAYYPGVVEKTWFGIGKVIYFNYDPGATEGILDNTLRYLS